MSNKILRLPVVLTRTGLSRSTIYYFIKEKKFPSSIPIGLRAVGWLESEIDAWIASQVQASHIVKAIKTKGSNHE